MPKAWMTDEVQGHRKMTDTQASKAAEEWCAQAIPYMEYLQQQVEILY